MVGERDTTTADAVTTATTSTPGLDSRPELTVNDLQKPTRKHIVNCSYESWYRLYRPITGKARIIPLSQGFVDYLREDGIVLPDEGDTPQNQDNDSGIFSAATGDDDEDDDAYEDPTYRFAETHEAVKRTIAELGGSVYPKLNWSAPKDAAFILGNTLKCSSASDIYLLLKSSDFITHDLEHAFDDTLDESDDGETLLKQEDIKYHLVLRKWVEVVSSVEFRCFVRGRKLLGVSQRDMNFYDFLEGLREEHLRMIREFFEDHLQDTFYDSDFVFDVYIPRTTATPARVWLIDFNPYALRTDPLLYSWAQILNINPDKPGFIPEMRLVGRNDPEAYNFNSSQYSAHKLPKDVVDAGIAGPQSIADFATRWKEIVQGMEGAGFGDDSDSDGESTQEKATDTNKA